MASKLNLNSISLEELKAKAAALPEALDTSDATATAADILSGETAYVNGQKVTGTIATKTSSNLTASGATVTVPSGYYASQATKSVTTATQVTPSVSIDANGKITATSTQSAGYVSAGTKTGTKQLATQAAKTVTPTKSSQTAVAKNVYTTGVVTVGAIPDQYQDITTPLADLNAANGGTAATTIGAAVNNTEAHASSQEALIAQIAEALEGKAAGGSGSGSGSGVDIETCTVIIDDAKQPNDMPHVSYITVENGEICLKTLYLSFRGYLASIKPEGFSCVKGTSMVYGFPITTSVEWNSKFDITGDIECLGADVSLGGALGVTFRVNGDGTIAWK